MYDLPLTPHPLLLACQTGTLMRKLAILILGLLTAACGFQLRGQATLPFESLYVNASVDSPFAAELKRAVRASSTRLSDNPNDAQATLQVMGEVREKQILSLSGGGRVREFELRLHISFRLHDNKGQDWIPQTEINLKRDFSFNDTQVLAKEFEESLLYKDMQSDAVQQVVRRMSVVKVPS